MASQKILAQKQNVIDEIKNCVSNSKTYVLFDYRGLTDSESKELRIKLRATGSDYKVYKNTLMSRALSDLNVDLDADLIGPSALAYSTDEIAPIKVLTDFAKNHQALVVKVGVVDGKVSDKASLASLANIPSRDGLLTMLAASMMAIPRDLAIGLDLYAKQKEEN